MKMMKLAFVTVVALVAPMVALAGPSLKARPKLRLIPVVSESPVPAATLDQPLTPMAEPGAQPAPAAGGAVTLYHCVKYKDECNIAPCAVPMIVTVKDPCDCCDTCDPCCTPKCVAVQICVPPCSECPPRVTCKRGGEYVKYDYGKYRVEITSRKGVVTVDYDD
jgi:hypothetical protein